MQIEIDLLDVLQIASIAATTVGFFNLRAKVNRALCRLKNHEDDISALIISDQINHPENSLFSRRRNLPAIFELVLSKYLKDRGLSCPEAQALSHQEQQCPHNPSQTSPTPQQNSDLSQLREN